MEMFSQGSAPILDFLELTQFGSQLTWGFLPSSLLELTATETMTPITGINTLEEKKNG